MSNFSEAAGKVDMLLRRDPLIAEEDDEVFVESPRDFGKGLVIQRRRQIDTVQFGAQCTGDGTDLESS